MSRLIKDEEIIERVKKYKGDKYKFIERDKLTLKIKLLHLECGNIWETSLGNLKKRRCSKCVHNFSIFSIKVENELIRNKINYKKEISFDGCFYKGKLKFDFGVYDLNWKLLYLIECDGEQHFQNVTKFKNKLSLIKLRDSIKNRFCHDNGIKLFRIKFDSNIKDEIKMIIKETPKNDDLEINLINISTPRVNKEFCNKIRLEYLKCFNIKKISKKYKYSENLIKKIINYEYCGNYDLDIKDEIIKIYNKSKPKNRFFKDLKESEINEIIKLKKNGLTDNEIGRIYNVNRKSFKNNIPNWSELTPNHLIKGKNKKVIHLIDNKIFSSLKEGCEYYKYKYVNEARLIQNNSKYKKFNWV